MASSSRAITASPERLQIEWHARPYSDPTTRVIVSENSAQLLTKLAGGPTEGLPGRPTIAEFSEILQREISRELNDRLRAVAPALNELMERQLASEIMRLARADRHRSPPLAPASSRKELRQPSRSRRTERSITPTAKPYSGSLSRPTSGLPRARVA